MNFQFRKALVGMVGLGAALVAFNAKSQMINGAGASFPAPAYQKWMALYAKESGEKINYQSVGSGAGIAQIKAKTVDFGASDEPLSKEAQDAAGLVQFPMLMGGIVMVVNVPGVKPGELKLSGEMIADIFLGKIKKWNDAQIAKMNEGLELPDLDIIVVHRADGSGTTWNFTNYLVKVSKEWADGPGCDKQIKWPVGIGGYTNSGVAANVKKQRGSIGYVESAYAFENKMAHTQVKNAAGKFVQPEMKTFQAAAANADWKNAPGFYMVLTNQPGDESWPMMAATYILVYKEQDDAVTAGKVLKFFDWAYSKGSESASKLGYVPMPANVVGMVKDLWKNGIKSKGQPVYK